MILRLLLASLFVVVVLRGRCVVVSNLPEKMVSMSYLETEGSWIPDP